MKIKEAIIVEGVYDKIKLLSCVDALVVTTDGFEIFKDTKKLDYIRRLSKECGIVILTDSDRAGFLIRNFIKGAVNVGRVLNAFIPDIPGKEKRKKSPSKEGFIGVEGIKCDMIVKALLSAGCTADGNAAGGGTVTLQDFYFDGVAGAENSSLLRECITRELGLPRRISTKELLAAVNLFLDYEKYKKLVEDAKSILSKS